MPIDHLRKLPDDELLAEVTRLSADERQATVRLIALGELDARRLYLDQGCSSLFVYCTRVLKLSEHAAYGRIEVARAARRFPVLLDWLERGDVTLTTVCLLAPHLTVDNVKGVLEQARGRTKRQVEELVAALRPRPDAAALVRRLPGRGAASPAAASMAAMPAAKCLEGVLRAPSEPRPAGTGASDSTPSWTPSPAPPPRVAPLARGGYRLQVTIDRATEEKLRRARDLMRHSNPSGDIAAVLDRALDLLLLELERTNHAATNRPRRSGSRCARSRHIPAHVRRAVWRRDDGRCAFVGPAGRCGDTAFLEFHHVQAFADGGAATVENIQLRCRAHKQYESALQFGEFVARERPAPYSVRTELPLLLY